MFVFKPDLYGIDEPLVKFRQSWLEHSVSICKHCVRERVSESADICLEVGWERAPTMNINECFSVTTKKP